MSRRWAVLLAALLVLAVACNTPVSTPLPGTSPSAWTRAPATGAPTTTPPQAATRANPALKIVDYTMTRPTTVTGTWPVLCHARGKLPDTHCTPGSVAPRAKAEVCTSGFSAQVRPSTASTERAKTAAIRAYGLQYVDRKTIELDHLVPLSLLGSNDTSNLWAEVSDINGAGFRNTKDAVEDRIHDAVCKPGSQVSLSSAQLALARDWTTALATLGIK